MRDNSHFICERCMKLCQYIDSDNCTNEGVMNRWKEIFFSVCRNFGFNKAAIKAMWQEGYHISLTFTYKNSEKNFGDNLSNFCSDVFYCSDRWNLQRLMRCNWYFWNYMKDAEPDCYWKWC